MEFVKENDRTEQSSLYRVVTSGKEKIYGFAFPAFSLSQANRRLRACIHGAESNSFVLGSVYYTRGTPLSDHKPSSNPISCS